MGVSTFHGNAKLFAGQHIRCGGAATDIGRSAGGEPSVDPLCPSQSEFEHRFTARRATNPRRLGRDQRLEVHDIQKRRFQNLALQHRPADTDQGLLRERHGPFRHRVQVDRQTQFAQVRQKRGREQRLTIVTRERREVRQIRFIKTKGSKIIDGRSQSRDHRIASGKRRLAEKQMKDRLTFRVALFPVPVRHRELVQIGQQGERCGVAHGCLPVLVSTYVG